jgi:hypothetical protein
MMNKRNVQLVLLWLGLVALLAVGCSPAAGGDVDSPAARAAAWLIDAHRNDDGGFSSFSAGAGLAPSDVNGTIDALPALAAAGADTAPTLDYLSANGDALMAMAAEDGGQAGEIVLALVAAGQNPRDFAGHDFAAQLEGHLDETGAYGVADAYKQSLAMLGLAAAGQTPPESAAAWLAGKQAANGSWDDGFGTTDNPDATATAVMALLAAGRAADDPAVAAAVDFLTGAQAAEGGWSYGPGLPPGANSTALVVQAALALDEDPAATDNRWAAGGRSAREALLAFQSESGAFQADFGDGPLDDFYSTVQAIPAVAGRSLPPGAEN